jgi:hypothetical protein
VPGICLFNMGQDGYFVPCLKPWGHEGKHAHENLCNNMSCVCGAMKKRFSKKDKAKHTELQGKVYNLKIEMDAIEIKYRRV